MASLCVLFVSVGLENYFSSSLAMATLATLLSIKLIILGYAVLCKTGFHQCRWGYKNVEDLRYVVENYKKANIPLDTMWNDIDYMQNYLDFTTDAVNYPEHELKKFIEELHEGGQQYVLILDPGMCLSNHNLSTRASFYSKLSPTYLA